MFVKHLLKITILLNCCVTTPVVADSNSEFLENLNRQMDGVYKIYNDAMEAERQEAPKRAAREAEELERISQLDCSDLDFMRKKYNDIGDSAYRAAMSGSTPAAIASEATARQAFAKSQMYAQEMARRCY